MPIRAVVFDFDGTLADTLPVVFAAFQKTFQRYLGREVPKEEIVQHFGPTEEGVVRALITDGWRDAVAMYLTEYEANHHLCPGPFPGVVETLEELKASGVPMAVVTGKSGKSADISFRHIPVRRYFDSVTTGSHTRNAKCEGIQRAVAQWGLSPSEVAYVGDAPADVEQSKLAGVTPLSALWGSTVFTREQLLAAGPAAVLERPRDVISWVGRSPR